MRKIVLLLFIPILFLIGGCASNHNDQYLRVHIRANSNLESDQNIKYKVRDLVVEYVSPFVKDCASKEDVVTMLESKNHELTLLINEFLEENNFDYGCDIAINEEFFPTRTYEDLTLEENYYDALIINLGSGKGDNWWCVVYPPLCFKGEGKIVYKSKIKELIKKIWG